MFDVIKKAFPPVKEMKTVLSLVVICIGLLFVVLSGYSMYGAIEFLNVGTYLGYALGGILLGGVGLSLINRGISKLPAQETTINILNVKRNTEEIAQILTKSLVVSPGLMLSNRDFPFFCFSEKSNIINLGVSNTVMLGASIRFENGAYLTLKTLKETLKDFCCNNVIDKTMITTANELKKALNYEWISLKRAQALLTFFIQIKDILSDESFLQQRPDITYHYTEYSAEINLAINALSAFVAKKIQQEVDRAKQVIKAPVDRELSSEKEIKECSYETLISQVGYYLPNEVSSNIFAKTFASSSDSVPAIWHQLYQSPLKIQNKAFAASLSEKQSTDFATCSILPF